MAKKFTAAGVSTCETQTKFRFTQREQMKERANVLKVYKHTNIVFVELYEPMTKAEAIKWLQKCAGFIPMHADEVNIRELSNALIDRIATGRILIPNIVLPAKPFKE